MLVCVVDMNTCDIMYDKVRDSTFVDGALLVCMYV